MFQDIEPPIPSGCLDSIGTEAAVSVSALGSSASLPACNEKRTSDGGGWTGVAFTPTGYTKSALRFTLAPWLTARH